MSDEIKVGDKLAFNVRFDPARWKLCDVTSITPSGRIKCGNITLNPDLTVRGRGRHKWSALPARAHRITQEIADAIRKDALVARLKAVDWSELAATQLAAIAALIDASATSAGDCQNGRV